jgi:hypothetical protein
MFRTVLSLKKTQVTNFLILSVSFYFILVKYSMVRRNGRDFIIPYNRRGMQGQQWLRAAGYIMNHPRVRARAMGFGGDAWEYGRRAYDWATGPPTASQVKQAKSGFSKRGGYMSGSIHYRKPPRFRTHKQKKHMKKADWTKLNRYRIKFPIFGSVKVILGNQGAPGSAAAALGPQWERSTLSQQTNDNTYLCGYLVKLTSLHGVTVGQHNFAADTTGPSTGWYGVSNKLFDIKSDNTQMNACAHNIQCSGLPAQTDADYLVSSFDGDFTIGGCQQSGDQGVRVMICRRFDLPRSDTLGLEADAAKELMNSVNVQPNNQHWHIIYKKYFVLRGRGHGSARISQKRVKFSIPLNYKRSQTKRISTAAAATNYGTQQGYAFENSAEMYNDCYLVITSRALNRTDASDDVTANTPGSGVHNYAINAPSAWPSPSANQKLQAKINVKGYVRTGYRYRNSQVAVGSTMDDEGE